MKLNENQRKVVETVSGNISVIATAGSGKTEVLTRRIENLVKHNNVKANSILAITFSKKAKENIIKRLEKFGLPNVMVETFHSFALKIIHSYCGHGRYKVWTYGWEKEKFITDICRSHSLCEVSDVPYNDIMKFIALQKTNMKKPSDDLIYEENLPFQKRTMKMIYTSFEEMKERNSYIEFDDFLNMAVEILDKDISVLEGYRKQIKYILVDEYQDVSMAQAMLLDKLNTNNTMIVGDPLQAIYSFRGGKSEYILGFDSKYENTSLINLNTNYRCSTDIVLASNEFAKSIPDSKHKNYVESNASNGTYKKPEFTYYSDEFEEASEIAKKIKSLKESGEYKLSDIAILSRTNAQLQKLEVIFHNNGISYEVVDGSTFCELPEIKLIISYLKLALYQNDNESFSYVYNKPNRWLNKQFLEEVKKNSIKRNTSLYNAMFTIDRRNWRFKQGIDEIFEVINYIQNKKYNNVGEIVRYLRTRLDIDTFVSKGKQADDGSYLEKSENLDSFENICYNYSSIEELLSYLDELNETMNEKCSDKVKLLTIHRSKGMEYPVAFIIGCNDNLLPHYKNANIDDERRLLYVAITRAEKELFISSTRNYNNHMSIKSHFIDDFKDTISIRPFSKNKN